MDPGQGPAPLRSPFAPPMNRINARGAVTTVQAAGFSMLGCLQDSPRLCSRDVVYPRWWRTVCSSNSAPLLVHHNKCPPITSEASGWAIQTRTICVNDAAIDAIGRAHDPLEGLHVCRWWYRMIQRSEQRPAHGDWPRRFRSHQCAPSGRSMPRSQRPVSRAGNDSVECSPHWRGLQGLRRKGEMQVTDAIRRSDAARQTASAQTALVVRGEAGAVAPLLGPLTICDC